MFRNSNTKIFSTEGELSMNKDCLPDLELKLDPSAAGKQISPMLFGYNVEITRLGVWRGLGAEMVNNRKFSAFDERNIPLRWKVLGIPRKVTVVSNFGYAGNKSLLISGKGCGVGQSSGALAFAAGREYAVRLVIHSEVPVTVTIKIVSADGNNELFCSCVKTVSRRWETFSANFTAEKCCEYCQVQIISEADANCHIGAVSVMPSDAFFGMRRDVVEIFKKLHPASLRYPGGCYAEFFHWQHSLLPVDQRPAVGPSGLPFLLPENDDFDPVEIGLNEFIELCRYIDAEPAVTVRMSEVDAGNAADMVEYCNGSTDTYWGRKRAECGYPEPFNIKYWFLGNELWSFGRGGLKDPHVCGKKSAEFASAIRGADSAAHLTGCSYYDQEQWNKPLQQHAGKFFDEYSMHDYLFDHFQQVDDLEAVAKAPTTELKPYLKRVRDCLQCGMFSGKELSIAFDEWNIRWGSTGTAAMGLYVAGVLHLLCREADILKISRSYYFMAVNEGIVKVTPFSAELDASGLMFDLIGCHRNARLLPLPPLEAESDLDYCASFDPGKKVVYLTLINRSMSRKQNVAFSLPQECSIRSISIRGYEPVELKCDCDKFSSFGYDSDGNTDIITIYPGQIVCCSLELD